MEKYLILTNRHLSIYGKDIALFWATNGAGYSSDLRGVQLYTAEEANKLGDLSIPIMSLNMTEDDFDRFKTQKFPQYLDKDFIIKNTNYTYSDVCRFEKLEREEKDRHYIEGYCKESDYCECNKCDKFELGVDGRNECESVYHDNRP